MDITLSKLKYRNPNHRVLRRGSNFGGLGGVIDPKDDWNNGTRVFMAGRFSAKSSNQGTGKKAIPVRPRRRAYGPF